jgi:hypothetical protein
LVFVRTISKKTKYGLQALISLARRQSEGPVLIAALAKDDDIRIKVLDSWRAKKSRRRSSAEPAAGEDPPPDR